MSETNLQKKKKEKPEDADFGLKEDWHSVENILRQIIPVYDKTNRYISLGTDLKVRKMGLSLLREQFRGRSSFSVLDLGSGPGKMTQLLLSMSGDDPHVEPSVMLDALLPMMKVAKQRNPNSEGMIGVYETIPVEEETFDAAIAGFAIRDSMILSKALSETRRVLRENGLLLIVDLCKPDSRLKRGLVGFYWLALAPLIAFLAAGRLGLKFGALYTTYMRLPSNSEFLKLLEGVGFEVVETRFSMLDGVGVLLLKNKS